MIDEIFGPVLTVYVYDDEKSMKCSAYVMNLHHTL